MHLQGSVLLQSLLVNYFIPSNGPQHQNNPFPQEDRPQRLDNSIYSSEDSSAENSIENDWFLRDEDWSLTPIPDPKDIAVMSRFIVHNANWTSVGYISHQKGSEGRALADMFAVADGPVEKGSGIPYFYVSRLQAAVTDLLDKSNECSLMMSLAQTPFCDERGWDPEDPRCAHLTMTGTFAPVDPNSGEWPVAANALFSRHPSFKTLPPNHQFFVAKYNIRSITLQDTFGGPSTVSVDDYFNVESRRFGLKSHQHQHYHVVPLSN